MPRIKTSPKLKIKQKRITIIKQRLSILDICNYLQQIIMVRFDGTFHFSERSEDVCGVIRLLGNLCRMHILPADRTARFVTTSYTFQVILTIHCNLKKWMIKCLPQSIWVTIWLIAIGTITTASTHRSNLLVYSRWLQHASVFTIFQFKW